VNKSLNAGERLMTMRVPPLQTSLLQVTDVSLLKMTSGVGPALLGAYLRGGQLAVVIPLRKHKVAMHHAIPSESEETDGASWGLGGGQSRV
jgi:hypothetical protein